MSNLDFQQKTALVCGASRGIGLASAQALAARGARILLLARDDDALQAASETMEGDVSWLAVDMEATDALRDQVEERLVETGPVHILINNSGGPPGGPVFDAEAEAFVTAFRQHVLAAQTLSGLVVPGMMRSGYGRIVNIISTSVKQPLPNLGVSNTVRGAMASWAKTLSRELAPHGITVNNVLPGATRTERLESIIAARASREDKSRDETAAAMQAEIPARRFAEPEEVAAAVAFLASPAAGYITGINVPVDGGRLACL